MGRKRGRCSARQGICNTRRNRRQNTTTNDDIAPDSASHEIIQPVIERSVFRNANEVPFNVRLVLGSGGGTPVWMTEGAGIPVGQMALDYITLRPMRLAVMGVITEELLQHSSAEALLRRQFTALLTRAINDAALDPTNSGSATKPASLTNGITVNESVVGMLADFDGDLQRAIWYATPETWLSLQSNVDSDLGLGGGSYRGSVAIASRSAPAGKLTLIDPQMISLAIGALEIDASTHASLVMDSSPSESSVTPTAAQQVPMWQANAVGIRAQIYANWDAAPGAVAMVEIESGSPI